MRYRSPADFCAEYAKAHKSPKADYYGDMSILEKVTVVSEAPDTARVEAHWYTYGNGPDEGFYDVFERTAFILLKKAGGWRVHSEEKLPYD